MLAALVLTFPAVLLHFQAAFCQSMIHFSLSSNSLLLWSVIIISFCSACLWTIIIAVWSIQKQKKIQKILYYLIYYAEVNGFFVATQRRMCLLCLINQQQKKSNNSRLLILSNKSSLFLLLLAASEDILFYEKVYAQFLFRPANLSGIIGVPRYVYTIRGQFCCYQSQHTAIGSSYLMIRFSECYNLNVDSLF